MKGMFEWMTKRNDGRQGLEKISLLTDYLLINVIQLKPLKQRKTWQSHKEVKAIIKHNN